jgi:2-polyprenyl-6-methoxyphenol hydroxylase-like FAD-dependent oxidoreductase
MKIAINGAGVAGPTLAWWLQHYGHEPVLFERAPEPRSGGYLIDFWGIGYNIAEHMGILPKLHEQGYIVKDLRLLDQNGEPSSVFDFDALHTVTEGRYLSIARSEIAATIYQACDNVETRFGTHVTGIEEFEEGVTVELSDGTKENFDLVVGADGLHSKVRSLVFGAEEQFEAQLGVNVIAFTLPGHGYRDNSSYVSYPSLHKQMGRISLRDGKTLFICTFRTALLEQANVDVTDKKAVIRALFQDVSAEASTVLERLDDVEDFYFDRVSQIKMPHWTQGRVALVGDAAACASLLAGEGTGLAMTEAYVLAGELHRAQGNYALAFQNYEKRLQEFLQDKQKMALDMLAFFTPESSFQMFLTRMLFKLSSFQFLSEFFIRRMMRDDIIIPDYTKEDTPLKPLPEGASSAASSSGSAPASSSEASSSVDATAQADNADSTAKHNFQTQCIETLQKAMLLGYCFSLRQLQAHQLQLKSVAPSDTSTEECESMHRDLLLLQQQFLAMLSTQQLAVQSSQVDSETLNLSMASPAQTKQVVHIIKGLTEQLVEPTAKTARFFQQANRTVSLDSTINLTQEDATETVTNCSMQ